MNDLILLCEIKQEFRMMFPLKSDENTTFQKIFSLSLEAGNSQGSFKRFSSQALFYSSKKKVCEAKRNECKLLSGRLVSLLVEMCFSPHKKEDSISGKPLKTVTGNSSLSKSALIVETWI